jgi:hypothetical protein
LPSRHECWANLSSQIQDWLINDVTNPRSQEWKWGRDLFWISFIAAHPLFPQGSWPKWNSKISMDGPFIQNWIDRGQMSLSGERPITNSGGNSVLSDLWEEFICIASFFYPHKIVENS